MKFFQYPLRAYGLSNVFWPIRRSNHMNLSVPSTGLWAEQLYALNHLIDTGKIFQYPLRAYGLSNKILLLVFRGHF